MSFGAHSVWHPAGLQAARLGSLWWCFLVVCGVVYLAVMVALALAVRGPRGQEDRRRRTRVVGGATALSALVLLVLLGISVHAGRAMTDLSHQARLTVRVTAQQWFWEFQYPGDPPSQTVLTANEMHIPVKTPVELQLVSRDVIHSFWVPALHGKRDLIPGHDSTTYLEADLPGVYRGQCAEFCGAQHARMGFLVIAESDQEFQRWLAAQRRPAAAPTDDLARRGQEVFMGGPCPMCHNLLGTDAGGRLGPDLTHLASRRTLGAGTLPLTTGHLAGWVLDAQSQKPGIRMPPVPLGSEELTALLAYLGGLK
jgi:cytochrome c oxidase subunit 2